MFYLKLLIIISSNMPCNYLWLILLLVLLMIAFFTQILQSMQLLLPPHFWFLFLWQIYKSPLKTPFTLKVYPNLIFLWPRLPRLLVGVGEFTESVSCNKVNIGKHFSEKYAIRKFLFRLNSPKNMRGKRICGRNSNFALVLL